MSILDAVGDLASDAFSLVESAGDLAGELAPIVSTFNPVAGLGLQGFSSASDFIEQFGQDQVMRDRADECRGRRKGEGEGCEGGGGESFFTELARVLGETVQNTADELIAKSKELQAASDSEGKENFFILSAEVQGLSQELKIGGDMTANVIQSAGGAGDSLVKRG